MQGIERNREEIYNERKEDKTFSEKRIIIKKKQSKKNKGRR